MPDKFKPLEPPDSMFLNAAHGWIGLDDWLAASEELEQITPQNQAHPDVLLCRYGVYAKANKWDGAAEIANSLTKLLPEIPSVWIWLAYSIRRKTNGGIPQAKEILLASEPQFPREYLFPFNLACYCSQLHQFKEAEKWLKKASAIDEKTVQQMAIEDDDLKPLWDSMGGTFWKRE